MGLNLKSLPATDENCIVCSFQYSPAQHYNVAPMCCVLLLLLLYIVHMCWHEGAASIRAASRKADQAKVEEKLLPAVTPSTSRSDTSQSSVSTEDVTTSRAKTAVTKDDGRVTSSPPPSKKMKRVYC